MFLTYLLQLNSPVLIIIIICQYRVHVEYVEHVEYVVHVERMEHTEHTEHTYQTIY